MQKLQAIQKQDNHIVKLNCLKNIGKENLLLYLLLDQEQQKLMLLDRLMLSRRREGYADSQIQVHQKNIL